MTTTETVADTTISRIAKLLRHAEKASTEEEAAAYMQRAQTIATMAGIDEARIRSHVEQGTRKPILTQTEIRMGERGKRGLFIVVAIDRSPRRPARVGVGP